MLTKTRNGLKFFQILTNESKDGLTNNTRQQFTIQSRIFLFLGNVDSPFEAGDARQANGHQSKKQEDPHVGSELELGPQPSLITP